VLGKSTVGAAPPIPTQPAPAVAHINLGDRYATAAETSSRLTRFGGLFISLSGKALNPRNSVAGPIFSKGFRGKNCQ